MYDLCTLIWKLHFYNFNKTKTELQEVLYIYLLITVKGGTDPKKTFITSGAFYLTKL